MKICHVNCALSGGGLEQYLAQLFDELKKRGHETFLLYAEKSDSNILSSVVKTYYIEDAANFNCKDTTYKLKKTRQILRDEKPDIVYIHQVTNAPLIDFLTEAYPSLRFSHGFKLICPEGKNMLRLR